MNPLSLIPLAVLCSFAYSQAMPGLGTTIENPATSEVTALTAPKADKPIVPWLASFGGNMIKSLERALKDIAEKIDPEALPADLQPVVSKAKTVVADADFDPAVQWIEQAISDSDKAIQGAQKAVENIDVTPANEWIHGAALTVQNAINGLGDDAFGNFLKTASKEPLDNLQAIKIENVPKDVAQYVRDHPVDVAFYLVDGIIFFYPGLVYGPVLGLLGFGAKGHRAASIAAKWQSGYGAAVPVGSMLSKMTSAGMGGTGRYVVAGLTRVAAVAAGAAKIGNDAANSTTTVPEIASGEKSMGLQEDKIVVSESTKQSQEGEA